MKNTPILFIASDAALPEGALRLDNTADVVAQAETVQLHSAVVLHFPKWTDGRAAARLASTRGRVRFAGQIIATGEVLADMLPLLRRCGFDAVQLRADQLLETAQRALGYFDSHYQTTPPERAAGAVQ